MILTNRTLWNTADLEAIILAALNEAEVSYGREHVHVVYGRGYSGFCYYPWSKPLPVGTRSRRHVGARMVLRVPRPPHDFDAALFVWLVRHEVGHWRGLRHTQMHELLRHRKLWLVAGRPLPSRFEGLNVRLDEIRSTRDSESDRAKRIEHARKMLAKAQRRAKLAATIEKKWGRKLGVLERYAAKAASREREGS